MRISLFLVGATALALVAGCGNSLQDRQDIEDAFADEPYKVMLSSPREGLDAETLVLGMAIDPRTEARLRFAVAVGLEDPKSFNSVLGRSDNYVTALEGFEYTDDSNQHSDSREVAALSNDVQDALCRKATGDDCPIGG